MRAAVNEELETQRILTSVAKLKTTSGLILAEAAREAGDVLESEVSVSTAEDKANGQPEKAEVEKPADSPRKSGKKK